MPTAFRFPGCRLCQRGPIGSSRVVDTTKEWAFDFKVSFWFPNSAFERAKPTSHTPHPTHPTNSPRGPGNLKDMTISDIMNSAFGSAGQRCMAASVLIVVGKGAPARVSVASLAWPRIRTLSPAAGFQKKLQMALGQKYVPKMGCPGK